MTVVDNTLRQRKEENSCTFEMWEDVLLYLLGDDLGGLQISVAAVRNKGFESCLVSLPLISLSLSNLNLSLLIPSAAAVV